MHGLTRPLPPVAPRKPQFSVHHGVELVDEYAWLRAENWQEVMRDPATLAPEIRAHLEAENAYTAAMLGDTEALQTTHTAFDDPSTPQAATLATGEGVKVATFSDGLDPNNPDLRRPSH